MHSSHNTNQQIDPSTGQPKKEGLMDKIKDAVSGHKDNTNTTHGSHGNTNPTTGYADQGVTGTHGQHNSGNTLGSNTQGSSYGNTQGTQPGYATAGIQQQQGYGQQPTGTGYGQESHNPLTAGHPQQQTGEYNSGIGSNQAGYQSQGTQGAGFGGVGQRTGAGYGQENYNTKTNTGYGSSNTGATHGGVPPMVGGVAGTHGTHSSHEQHGHGHHDQHAQKPGMMDKLAGKVQEATAKNPEDKQEGHIRATQGKQAAQQFDQQTGSGAYGGNAQQPTGYGNTNTGYANTTGNPNY